MIKINFYLCLSVVLIGYLLFLFLSWLIARDKQIKLSSSGSLYQCPICFYMYLDFSSMELSRCPRCNSYSKKGGV